MHFLQNFVISVLASLFAWLLTVKIAPEKAKNIPRYAQVGFLAAIAAAAYLTLTLFPGTDAKIRPNNSEESDTPSGPSKKNDSSHGGTNSAGSRAESEGPSKPLSPEEEWLKKYLAAPSKTQSTSSWCVLLRLGEEPAPSELTGAAVSALTERDRIGTFPFRPEVFQTAGYQPLYSADSLLLSKLQDIIDGLIVGEVKETSSVNEGLEQVVTTTASISVRVFSIKNGNLISEFELTQTGPGFSAEASRTEAARRLAHELKQRLLSILK